MLRPLAEDDIDPVADACNDPETLRWLPLPRPYGRPEARWFIDIFAPTTRDSGAGIIRAIEREGRLVGCIDVKRVDWAARTAEVGYWVAPWGRGSRRRHERHPRDQRAGCCASRGSSGSSCARPTGNLASQRVAEKAGFVREGVARNAGRVHDGRVDLVVYSLTRADLGLEQQPGQRPRRPADRARARDLRRGAYPPRGGDRAPAPARGRPVTGGTGRAAAAAGPAPGRAARGRRRRRPGRPAPGGGAALGPRAGHGHRPGRGGRPAGPGRARAPGLAAARVRRGRPGRLLAGDGVHGRPGRQRGGPARGRCPAHLLPAGRRRAHRLGVDAGHRAQRPGHRQRARGPGPAPGRRPPRCRA